MPRTTSISRVETYLNWLLKSHKYSIVPVVIPTPNLTLADVNTITFKPYAASKKNPHEGQSDVKSKWVALADSVLAKIPELLFGESESLPDIEWKSVISAELILKIKDQSKIKNEEFQKIFGSLLKPVSEADQIVLKNRKGESIKGSEILKTKPVEIEMTENKFLVEPNLHQEMARFLDELAGTKIS